MKPSAPLNPDTPLTMSILVNLYGAPGCGKTTMAMAITSALRFRGMNAEYVHEVAKEYTYGAGDPPINYEITARQFEFLKGALEQNRIVVTDSPVILGKLYDTEHAMKYVDMLPPVVALHYFLELPHKEHYITAGRYHTYEQAKEIEERAKALPVIFNMLRFGEESVEKIVNHIEHVAKRD